MECTPLCDRYLKSRGIYRADARRDALGIVLGFYRQSTSIISGAESEMASLLSGLHLDRGGIYAIAQDDVI